MNGSRIIGSCKHSGFVFGMSVCLVHWTSLVSQEEKAHEELDKIPESSTIWGVTCFFAKDKFKFHLIPNAQTNGQLDFGRSDSQREKNQQDSILMTNFSAAWLDAPLQDTHQPEKEREREIRSENLSYGLNGLNRRVLPSYENSKFSSIICEDVESSLIYLDYSQPKISRPKSVSSSFVSPKRNGVYSSFLISLSRQRKNKQISDHFEFFSTTTIKTQA